MAFTAEKVRALKGAPLSIMVLLSLEGTGVSNDWLVANSGYTGKPIASALGWLQEHGYVVLTSRGWKLAGNTRQLPLSAEPFAPGSDPAPLQAGVPLDDQAVDGSALREADGNSVSIVFKGSKESESDSINNNNNGGARRNFSASLTERRGQSKHVADIAAALLLKKTGQAPGTSLPADLAAAAGQLVARVNLPRDKAELVVARSPWAAEKILEQIEIWLAYRQSPYGADLDARFPWLVAARIERGEECPKDTRGAGEAESRYDGYLQYLDPEESES